MEKQDLFYTNKKGVETQLIMIEVLVYRATIREATPRVVSLSAYHLVAKIYQFSIKRFKAMTSNIINRRIAILVIIKANI